MSELVFFNLASPQPRFAVGKVIRHPVAVDSVTKRSSFLINNDCDRV
jgi:hypothetical protein